MYPPGRHAATRRRTGWSTGGRARYTSARTADGRPPRRNGRRFSTCSPADDPDLDAAVAGPAGFRRVVVAGLRGAVSACTDPHAVDAVAHKVRFHGVSP